MSKKWLVVSISVALMVLGTSALVADAAPGGAPALLDQLWAAIDDLQDQIDDIQPAVTETYRVTDVIFVEAGGYEVLSVFCDDGDKVTGGGFLSGEFGVLEIVLSAPDFIGVDDEAWTVGGLNQGDAGARFQAYAVCLDLGEPHSNS